MDVLLQLALLTVFKGHIVLGQPGAPLPVLQQDEPNLEGTQNARTGAASVAKQRRATQHSTGARGAPSAPSGWARDTSDTESRSDDCVWSLDKVTFEAGAQESG